MTLTEITPVNLALTLLKSKVYVLATISPENSSVFLQSQADRLSNMLTFLFPADNRPYFCTTVYDIKNTLILNYCKFITCHHSKRVDFNKQFRVID